MPRQCGIVFIGLAGIALLLQAQPPVERPSMFAGTHFFVGFLQNEIERGSSLRLQLSIASRAPTTVEIRLPNESHPRRYHLNGGEYRWIALPPELEARLTEQPLAIAAEIRSDAPIVVYAFNSQTTTTDAYTAIPVPNWGTEYVIASLPNDFYTPRPGDTTVNRIRDLILRRSQWMVVAAYDSTVVTFVPRVRTSHGKAAGVPHTVVLNRGECYLVQSDSTPRGLGDMTGTLVRSSKPVGVLSGHVRVSLPSNLPPEVDTKDHIVEMLPPVPAVGQRYISTPFAIGTGDWFRAIALRSQTHLTLTRSTGSTAQTMLQNVGDVADFPAEAAPILWEADKPFLLVQFMYSATIGGPQALVNPYFSFDPLMVIIPPLDQYVQQAHFFVPDTTLAGFSQFKRHWINLAVTADALTTLQLNGIQLTRLTSSLAAQQLPWAINGKRYHWVQFSISPGRVYELRTAQGEFAGILYGTGYVDSYGLVLGSGLLPPGQNDVQPPVLSSSTYPCGSIVLRCRDDGSGIAWIQPIPDSSWNYSWSYTQPSRSEATLTAQPQDLRQDGQLLVEARDNTGNRRWYRHQYWTPRLQWQPSVVQFLHVLPSGTRCQNVTLTNIGKDTVQIVRLRTRDSRLSVQASLPITLPPHAAAFFQVCFDPGGIMAPLLDSIIVETSCIVTASIPVEGSVDSVALQAEGCSIGAILVEQEGQCRAQWINTGNRDLTVVGIRTLRKETAFTLDTAGHFPRALVVGDTLRLPVRFRPPHRGIFWEEFELETTPATAVKARVEGRGIAPFIASVTVDWGSRRIGRRYDSVLALVNQGDAPTDVYLIADSGSSSLGHGLSGNVHLRPGDTLSVPIWFTPIQRQRDKRSLVLQSSWQPHPPIAITLLGNGMAPEIQTTWVDFDTVWLGSSRDTVALVLSTAGNESTTLDTLWLEGPDAAAFAILSPPTLPQQFSPGSFLRLALQFRPMRIGHHEARLVFRHNGKPPYTSDTVHTPLRGYGKALPPVDTFTVRWQARAHIPKTAIACREVLLRLCVWNHGNTLILCEAVQLQGATLSAIEPLLPQPIAPADSVCWTLKLSGLPAGKTEILLHLSLRSE
ncbi:MAG: IgGFc-binding protein [Candidatus Kapabacteria bacterium]|nr:IgGFc-binding protein [Candidatus Kapabacteria bacterium]MDW7996990.1 IgGFc-binding protein [Bacteroidota bacterium]